ncbi:MAG: SRPBCC family protein [Phycisphaerales bacterium]|nr:SRPBCC family protein [Phycisphaerales bacterium]
MKRLRWFWLLAGVVVIAALLLLPLSWPDALVGSRIVNRIQIAAPPERVFAYIATPANWPRWHPASRRVRGVTDRTPAVGESVIETFEVAGRHGDATWATVELSPPRRWAISATSAGGGARIVYTLTPIAHDRFLNRSKNCDGDNSSTPRFAQAASKSVRLNVTSASAGELSAVSNTISSFGSRNCGRHEKWMSVCSQQVAHPGRHSPVGILTITVVPSTSTG